MIDYVNDRFEFYKKMEDNQSMKNMILKMMYSDYHKQNQTSVWADNILSLLLGGCRLKLTQNGPDALKLVGDHFVLGIDKNHSIERRNEFVQEQINHWYWIHSEKRLKDKTNRYAKLLGLTPKSVSVREYKSRWGSCSIHGDISYNWKVIIAPHRIVDYVVVHELCHMLEHNHSPAYWKRVKRTIADYEDCREWLKINGSRLVV